MGPRHSPEEPAEASPVRLDATRLERWEDLARRHDDSAWDTTRCSSPETVAMRAFSVNDFQSIFVPRFVIERASALTLW